MDVLRSVIFGLLTVSFILVGRITEYWSASASTVATLDQSQISAQSISDLNNDLKQARTDATRTFWNNCLSFTCDVNQSAFDPPSFQGGKLSTGEILQEMFHVSNNFTQLLDTFLKDIKEQQTYPKLASDLNKVNSSLSSVELFLQQLKPNLQKGTTTVDICTVQNSGKRNSRNIQIVARLAIEMDKMSKVLSSLQ